MFDGASPSMSSPGKQFSVLSQVTNSYVAPTMEAKGDFMSQMDGMNNVPSAQVNQPKAVPKKANAAADSKKKWMRRI